MAQGTEIIVVVNGQERRLPPLSDLGLSLSEALQAAIAAGQADVEAIRVALRDLATELPPKPD